jgi:phosphoglycolate phosphatase-like HAD superfamily hydrolase
MKLIIFDFDGTLEDSRKLIIEAHRRVFSQFGLPVPGAGFFNDMAEAQFVAFQAVHAAAVFRRCCCAGRDPDINIRAFLRRRVPFGCGG